MKDPLLPPDLEKLSDQPLSPCFRELATVKETLSKLENAQGARCPDLEISRNQLADTKRSLTELTDQMGKFYQTFNAMKSWRSHLFNSYDNLLVEKNSKSQN